MREGRQSENIISSLVDIAENVSSKKKSVSFFEEESSQSMSAQFNRLFGRKKPVHHLLGGGRCKHVDSLVPLVSPQSFVIYSLVNTAADVMLWRNKKISASVLSGATVVWILFEWFNYHFLSFLCFALALGMLSQFLWSNVSGLLNK